MNKVTGKCPACNKSFEGKTDIGLKRIITAHLRFAHGQEGITATASGRRYNSNYQRFLKEGFSPEQAEAKAKELLQKYKANPKNPPRILPLKLDHCERCGLEFLGRKEGKMIKIKSAACPDCDAMFYITEA